MTWEYQLKPVTFTDLEDCVAKLKPTWQRRLGIGRHSSQWFRQEWPWPIAIFQAAIGRQEIKLGHYVPSVVS